MTLTCRHICIYSRRESIVMHLIWTKSSHLISYEKLLLLTIKSYNFIMSTKNIFHDKIPKFIPFELGQWVWGHKWVGGI